MIGGYNENVEHSGKIYHIQTENLGIDKGIIRTAIYDQGVIVATRQTNYQKLRDKKTPKEIIDIIDVIIKKQHRLVVEELLGGKFDKKEKKEVDPLSDFLEKWSEQNN